MLMRYKETAENSNNKAMVTIQADGESLHQPKHRCAKRLCFGAGYSRQLWHGRLMRPPVPIHEVKARPFASVRVYADETALTQALAHALWHEVTLAREGGPRAVMLSGGSTPLNAYALLASQQRKLGTAPLHGFLSDERYVPVTDPGYNYAYAHPFLASINPSPTAHLAVDPSIPLQDAATRYGNSVNQLLAETPLYAGVSRHGRRWTHCGFVHSRTYHPSGKYIRYVTPSTRWARRRNLVARSHLSCQTTNLRGRWCR